MAEMLYSTQGQFDIMHEIKPLVGFANGNLPFLTAELDDTGLVIQATSLIDRFLRLILISGFRHETISKTLLSNIFDGNGPLSTFSSRIAVSTALGLTSPDVKHDLAIIKTVRNAFAHSYMPISLSDYGQIKSLIVSVSKIAINDSDEFRFKFKHSCAGIVGFLCQFALLATARDRFVSKHKDDIILEMAALQREAAAQPVR